MQNHREQIFDKKKKSQEIEKYLSAVRWNLSFPEVLKRVVILKVARMLGGDEECWEKLTGN